MLSDAWLRSLLPCVICRAVLFSRLILQRSLPLWAMMSHWHVRTLFTDFYSTIIKQYNISIICQILFLVIYYPSKRLGTFHRLLSRIPRVRLHI
jgi:hypothetical protein